MCGIAAVFGYGEMAPPVERGEVLRMRDHMAARGPDGEGEWFADDGRVGFGHRRLSIIDLSAAGAEPMFNHDRSLAIIFNGEIYNYRDLRERLLSNGYQFHGHCDAEVVLALYETEGEGMLNKLRGMYAFAIWDTKKRGLFLARDPFGIKPLYYSDNGNTFRVASQIKALRAGGKIDTAPDPAGHVGFFLWGHVPDPYTMYRGIRSVPAGHTMWVGRDGPRAPRSFCNITSILREAEESQRSVVSSQSSRAPVELLRSALAETVKFHLVADVPVGVFLSSGLDSTTIAALAAEQGGNLRTVTLGFKEYQGTEANEVPLAEEFAKRCGTNHQTIWVRRSDFESEREHLFEAMDSPSIDGVNTFFVSLAAKQAGLKVAMSGVGGDELFGSYPSFHDIPRTVGTLQPFNASTLQPIGRGLRMITAPIIKRFTSPKYAGLFEYGGTYSGAYLLRRGMFMPWELPDILDPEFVRAGWNELQTLLRLDESVDGIENPRLKVSALELNWYMRNQLLRDADWAGMAHSVEIRVPFVDVEFLRRIAPVLCRADAPPKRDIAAAASKLMTPEILNRRKMGFQVPVRDWLRSGSKYKRFDQWQQSRSRGLRGWAREVYSQFTEPRESREHQHNTGAVRSAVTRGPAASKLKILMLLSDAFGGFGGIAKFNRDFITAFSSSSEVDSIVAIPRLMQNDPGPLPPKLVYETAGLSGKKTYVLAALRAARKLRAACWEDFVPVVVCGHINVLPAALAATKISGAKLYLVVHGVDAWQPTPDPIANRCVGQIDDFISVSSLTRRRFLEWSGVPLDKGIVLPNCVDLSKFTPGEKSAELLSRYQLNGDRVLLTLARLDEREAYKGIDEIIECLPDIGKSVPRLAYMVAGEGTDRPRLVAKARSLGLRVDGDPSLAPGSDTVPDGPRNPRVIFTGRLEEASKPEYMRLADLFVMPSSGEGFGIVLLEAMACGIPVIGSKIDGSREALKNGELGTLVDPRNLAEIKGAILANLGSRRMHPQAPICGVEYFSTQRFEERVHSLVVSIVSRGKDAVDASATQDVRESGEVVAVPMLAGDGNEPDARL